METVNNEFNPSQSLQIIADAISQTKENIRSYSFLFLLWGWLIAIASFSFYVLHTYTSFKLFFLPFPILALGGIVTTIVYFVRRQYVSETYLGYYLNKLWMVLGISFILAVFINVSQHDQPFTYTLLIGGIGTLTSGLALRFKPLIIGGGVFFLFSVASIFVADNYQPLLQGIAVIVGYLVPGYLLKYSKT
jgi:hypothetical protein